MLIKAHLVGIPRSNDNLYSKYTEISNMNKDVPDMYRLTEFLDYCKNSNDEYYFQTDLVEADLQAAERIKAFLKFKGIQNHYTFREFYQCKIQNEGQLKPEIFILFPLYIRMKDTKVFEQMKILEHNPETNEIIAKEVNPDWFIIEKTPISKKKRKRNEFTNIE